MILKHTKKGKAKAVLIGQVSPKTSYQTIKSIINNITGSIENKNPMTKMTQPMWTVGKK
jgi:hypothetical protein